MCWGGGPDKFGRNATLQIVVGDDGKAQSISVITEHKKCDNLPPITAPEFHASPEDIVTFEAHILSYKLLGSYALSGDMQSRIPELKPCRPDWPAKIEKIKQAILNAEYLVRDLYNEIDAANMNTGSEGEAKREEDKPSAKRVE